MSKEILVYITADENRVISGEPLALLVQNPEDQQALTFELSRALKADAVQLTNGDYLLITETEV